MPTYTDLHLSCKKHPFTNDILVKNDIYAVKQALINIFLTNRFEKPFEPDFGLGLELMMFETFDSIKKNILEKRITTMISYYEPRVQIESVSIDSNHDYNELTITLLFYVTGIHGLQTLDYNVERVR
jgi:phage baseplate assembly protein W